MKTEGTKFHQLSLYIGLDVQRKQWSVSIYTPAAHHRTFSQPPNPKALKNYLNHHFRNAQVVCAYEEACKFGYWIQRELASYGYQCLVVNPADIPPQIRNHPRRPIPVQPKDRKGVTGWFARFNPCPSAAHRRGQASVSLPERALG